MIKYFCDRCGKEITDNVNAVVEHNEAKDALGITIMTFPEIIHLCDECQYNELTCGFKVGDKVISDDGRVGQIIDICPCDQCQERGFCEPEVEFDDGRTDYITVSNKKNGFRSFYKIGDHIFGNLDDSYLVARTTALKEELYILEKQLNVVRNLKNN